MTRTMKDLAAWTVPEETCLLLGAGASVPSGAPSADLLAEKLINRFDPKIDPSAGLSMVAEIIEHRFGRRPLIEAVVAEMRREPIGGIADLPAHPWRSIFTTNFDNLVETAAASLDVPVALVRSKFDFPQLDQLGALRLFKLHGCVTQDRVFGDPSSLVITRGDYRKVRKWKSDLLQRMQVELETSKILIIGNSLSDPHLDEIIEELLELQEELGFNERVSILAYNALPDVVAVFEGRGIKVTVGDIDWFVAELAAAGHAAAAGPTSRSEPDATDVLHDTLRPVTIDVNQAVRADSQVRKMFSGSPASYFDIVSKRTFNRDLLPRVEARLAENDLAVIVGAAGLGKTTMARQVALRRREAGVQVFEHRIDLPLDVDGWTAVNDRLAATDRRGLLLLDNATTYQRRVNDLLRSLGRSGQRSLEILVTAERHRWDRLSKHPSLLEQQPFQVGRLSRTEVRSLLRTANDNDDVRSLIPSEFKLMTDQQQMTFLERYCESDIFICLRHVFASSSFDTIILEEFAELDDFLQDVYRLVAGLEAVSGGSHRQLIMRMFGLRYEDVPNLLDQMEGLLVEGTQSTVDGIYVWRTRHPQIAEIITRYKYADPEAHLNLILDLIENLNPSVDIERNAIRGLCNSTLGLDFLRDGDVRTQIFETLTALLPDDHVLRHRLVREFLRRGEFSEAEQVLEKAISDVGIDPPLVRYRIELYRQKAASEPGLMAEDRLALLRWAWVECQNAANYYSENWFTYRSMIEVGMDWLDRTGDPAWLTDATAEASDAYERLYEPKLLDLINKAERKLRFVRPPSP